VLKGPELYDPAGGSVPNASPQENEKRARGRWSWVLDREVQVGLMSKSERAKYTKFPMPQQPKSSASQNGQIGYLMDTAKKYVLKNTHLSQAAFDKGGYQIYTTFDKKKVTALANSVKKVDKRYINPEKREKDKYVQFGGASVEPGTGKIVAIYGGEGYDKGHFSNNADTFGVPVGSTWKPFVLAAAMKYGTQHSNGQPLSPESRYNGNDHLKVKNADGTDYLTKDNSPFYQKNEGPTPWGYISLTKAMEQSVNTPFVQLGMDVGMSKVRDMARAAGIADASFDKYLNPSFALGTSTPSAIRMANAYATFAKSGTKVEPYSVTEVKHHGESVDGIEAPTAEPAIDPDIANNVTKVLENVITNGTAKDEATKLGRPAAGKTGTTDENKSAWFVGYTPQLSTAIAMFREDPKNPRQLSMNGVGGFDSIHGGALPTQVWTQYMIQALEGTQSQDFPAATPIGQRFDEAGMPTEKPTPPPSQTPSHTPSEKPSHSETPTHSPTPTDTATCADWDIGCHNDGGTTGGPGGGTGGGPGGGPGGPGGDTGGDTQTPDPTGGGGPGGGWLGGPSGESP
jgi:membrane peptidoglycan carboxypeptidase